LTVCFVDNLKYAVIIARTVGGDEYCRNGRDGGVLFPVQLSNLQLMCKSDLLFCNWHCRLFLWVHCWCRWDNIKWSVRLSELTSSVTASVDGRPVVMFDSVSYVFY